MKYLEGTKIKDLTGMKFGKLIVVEFDFDRCEYEKTRVNNGGKSHYTHYWICKCDCGKETSVRVCNLTYGSTTSCGLCYTFEDWCLDNNHQDYLDLWDYKLNDKKPSEIGYGVGTKYYFRCERGIHESVKFSLNSLTNNKNLNKKCLCKKCVSVGQYLIDNFGDNGVLNYWGKRNTNSAFDILKGSHAKIWIMCHEHGEYAIGASSFCRGVRCAICSNKKVREGVNDIHTTHKWMIGYFYDVNDSKKYTYSSNKYVLMKCPHCNSKKRYMINRLYQNKNLPCECGDGALYPNKFITSMLNQLNIKFETEKTFEWSDRKRYDHHINCKNIIIENHGEQHYEQTRRNLARTLEEEQANDRLKKELALTNGVKYYIQIDCRKSELEWIKDSVMNSELPILLNFKESDIDWFECEKFALSNRVKQICDLWNNIDSKDVGDLVDLVDVCRGTVIRYLKTGANLGWCEYCKSDSFKVRGNKLGKINMKKVEVIKDGCSIGIFESARYVDRISLETFGVKLCYKNISAVLVGKRNHHKGFVFKYA